MAVYQVQSNGTAPPGLSAGDYVNTNGGMYMITSPGAVGSTFNPASGYWSVKAGTSEASANSQLQSALTAAQKVAQDNTALSQSFAREQMAFQEAANAKAMQFSSDEAKKNRDWQEYMSNSAHQREVMDLIKAGLNPILAVNSGASTPSGASASGVTSSGSSGQVDTSYNSLLSSLVGQMLNRQTTLDVAALQAATSKYVADRGATASLGVAGINAASALQLADVNNAFKDYLESKYPSSWAGLTNNAINSMSDVLTGNSNSSSSIANLAFGLGSYVGDLIKKIQSRDKSKSGKF